LGHKAVSADPSFYLLYHPERQKWLLCYVQVLLDMLQPLYTFFNCHIFFWDKAVSADPSFYLLYHPERQKWLLCYVQVLLDMLQPLYTFFIFGMKGITSSQFLFFVCFISVCCVL